MYFGEGEVLVGKPVEDLIEDSENYEEEERLDITQRVVRSIKRNLINPPVIPILGRKPVCPADVVAEILGKLKRDVEEEHFQEEVECAVITCPAVFGSRERKVVFDATALAGFNLEADLESGQNSPVDEYFAALERSALEQVQVVVNQRSVGLQK